MEKEGGFTLEELLIEDPGEVPHLLFLVASLTSQFANTATTNAKLQSYLLEGEGVFQKLLDYATLAPVRRDEVPRGSFLSLSSSSLILFIFL